MSNRSPDICCETVAEDVFNLDAIASIEAKESSRIYCKADGVEVRGLAYLGGRIYILQADSKFLIVYSEEATLLNSEDLCIIEGEREREATYWKSEVMKNTNFNRPQDIAACSERDVLYVLDQSCIWEVDKNDKISIYVKLPACGYSTMSITGKRILVIGPESIRTYAYNPNRIGRPAVSEARMPEGLRQSGMKPWHALEIDDGHVVAHIEAAKYHRVSKVSQSQRNKAQLEVSTYGREAGADIDQLSDPVYLATERRHGHVFVADHDNQRVVVLDRKLQRRVAVISDLPDACYPSRLCYVDDNTELLVGLSNGWVIAYKFTRSVAFYY